MGTRLSSETPSISIRTSRSTGDAGFLSGGSAVGLSVGGAGTAASTDLQRDSWVADVVVGPRPPTNQEEHSTAYRE